MKKEIIEKLKLCKPEQINMFRKMYANTLLENSSVEELVGQLPKKHYKRALMQIEATIKKNLEPKIEIKVEEVKANQKDLVWEHCVDFATDLFYEEQNKYSRNSKVMGTDFDGETEFQGKKYYVKGSGYWEKATYLNNLEVKGVNSDYFKKTNFIDL